MKKLKSGIVVLWALLKVKFRQLFHGRKEAEIQQQIDELPKYKNPALNAARFEFERRGNLVQAELNKYVIPDDKIESVVEYAIKTLCNQAQMSDKRIARKAADYFKLKPKMQAV